jgi:hypothetical protein
VSEVPFEKIRDRVVNEITAVTNAYVLLTDFAFPVARQSRVSDHYPFFVDSLVDAFRGQILLAVCRLFDPGHNWRNATLSNFLRRVGTHHASDQDVDSNRRARRRRYERQIVKYLSDIEDRWKQLVIHRNAYVAHMDLTKTRLPAMTYKSLRQCFNQAQKMVGGYYAAYHDTAPFLDISRLKKDAASLLAWCRLDNYERHIKEERGPIENKLRQKGRARSARGH